MAKKVQMSKLSAANLKAKEAGMTYAQAQMKESCELLQKFKDRERRYQYGNK